MCSTDRTAPTFPGAAVTLHLSTAQVAYLRGLLFEDLHDWAQALVEQAHGAHETGGPIHGLDAMNTYRRNVTTDLLDLLGWDTADDIAAIRWLENQARERREEGAGERVDPQSR